MSNLKSHLIKSVHYEIEKMRRKQEREELALKRAALRGEAWIFGAASVVPLRGRR
jgi:hypothetical protein